MRVLPLLLLLTFALPAPAPARVDANPWLDRYAKALEDDPANGFYRYAVVQATKRSGGDAETLPNIAADPDRWRRQIYEMTTGAWSVQETLQLDRMLGSGDKYGPANIPVDSVTTVPAASIPFDKMLAGRKPVVEWLARAAPADWYYTHFPRVSAMRRVLGASDKWGSHLLSSYQITGRDCHVRERLESQLLLKATPELDSLYDLVVGEVAIVGSDPFFREGSDVSVIFGVTNGLLLGTRLENSRRDAVSTATSHVSILHENYRDWVVEGVATADHTVSSYAAIRDRIAIVSNSFAALRRIADTVDGQVPSMANADDFKFMRSVTPYSETDEDGFLFISDEFVRRVVGPRLKIGEARRLRCAASLQSIGWSSLMYRMETGRAPASIDELVEGKYLDRANAVCPDGGRFSFDGEAPVCSIHRRIGALTPNLELPIDKVSAEEVAAYTTFRENYSNYWRRYIDPVGVSVRARERLEVKANILPVVENSPYSSMQEAVGSEPVSLARPQLKSAIATLDVKLPKPSAEDIERDRTGSGNQFFGLSATKLLGQALGDSMSIQLADGSPTFATDLAGALDTGGFGPFEDWLFFAPLLGVFTLPTAVVAPVKDHAALDELLDAFRARVVQEGRRSDGWFGIEGYQVVQGGARTLEAVSVRFLFLKWRAYYAVAGDQLIVATDPALIDELASAEPSGEGKGALRLELAPGRWSRVTPSMAMSYEEDSRRACVANLSWLSALRTAFGREPNLLDGQAFTYFGTGFTCPDGGRYVASGATDVACSVHGTATRPRQGPRPQPGSPAAYVLENVRRIEATLTFTGDGLSTHLVIE